MIVSYLRGKKEEFFEELKDEIHHNYLCSDSALSNLYGLCYVQY